MGLFSSKKYDMYEKNALIAELQAKNDALTERVATLKAENADLRAKINRMQSSIDAIYNEQSVLSDGDDEEADGRIADLRAIKKDRQTAFELKQAQTQQFALELKRLKYFADKWQAFFANSTPQEKRELANLLTEIISSGDSVETIVARREKVQEFLDKAVPAQTAQPSVLEQTTAETDDFVFSLEDALSPEGGLDLATLCKDLGVFNG